MTAAALAVNDLNGGYGDTRVLRDVGLEVHPGTVAVLLGPNGAGKTTLLRSVAGVLPTASGSVLVDGEDVTALRAHQRAKSGICLIPEGRGIFPNLTVAENLRMAVPPWRRGTTTEAALEAFPVLGEKRRQRAGSLSGGQQQMLALSRCLLGDPRVVLLDEVSMGLAPKAIDEIFEALRHIAERGVALLLVEQYVHRALDMADHVFLMRRGAIAMSAHPDEVDADRLQSEYLGEASGE